MIKCTIKYDTFATINYEDFNKLNLYTWADASEHDCSIILNENILVVLINLINVPEYRAALDLILQNLTDLFYKFINTQNEFLKDSNEDVIILQRGDYYFENNQTKHIHEIVEK
ncbi:hypothetical protein COBT_003764, partial [Conglomerata obtusa]